MRPLDLATQRPRRATDTCAGGIVFLARTIDKVRAQLPGGVLGPYLVTSEEFQTMSAALFKRLDINEAEFRKIVGEAGDEREVIDWVLSRTTPETIAKWNERIGGLCIEHLDHETKRHLKSLSPTVVSQPESTPILEALDREDDAAWAAAKR